MKDVSKWKVKLILLGAYRLSGTGIFEKKSQNHKEDGSPKQ